MTRLYTGESVPKSSRRIAVTGAVDELVSDLGVCRVFLTDKSWNEVLEELQRKLFDVGTWAASKGSVPDFTKEDVEQLDELLRVAEEQVTMPTGFVVPGATVSGAFVDRARAMSRKLERTVSHYLSFLDPLVPIDQNVEYLRVWLNRLSDLLWLLARIEEGSETILK